MPPHAPLRRRRLLWRLSLHASVSVLVGFVAITLVNRLILAPYFGRLYQASALDYAAEICTKARLEPERLRREAARDRMEITVYDLGHRALFSTAEPPLEPLAPERLRALVRDRVTDHTPFSPRSTMLCEEGPGRAVAYLAVREPAGVLGLQMQLAMLCLSALLLALGSLPLARSVIRPLERLVGAVRAFGVGDLQARADASRPDEIGELGGAFNDMAERIVALLRREKELLANVSHELRTPLARIRVVLELAEERPESTRRYLPEIARDLAELERLVDDVLAAARLDLAQGSAGDPLPPLRRRRVEPGDVVGQAAVRFRREHPGRALRLEVSERLPALDADPALLRRALDNLLDNAQKYSDAESPVTLAAGAGEGGVTFRVSDQGIGIDEADLPRLFSPFFRTDRSRDRATGGLGLGLALARRIVEAHGGTVGLESRPGVGTTVSFVVPAAPPAAPPESAG